MKSAEVYALLRSALGPWFKSAGFKRAKSLLSWYRAHGDGHTVVWCQVSQDGWDAYAGSKFVVEFQRSSEPIPGTVPSRHRRMAALLPDDALEELRSLQNSVIASLSSPPASHTALNISNDVTHWYLRKFEPVVAPYSNRDDVWLRYATPEHVIRWGDFIRQRLALCVSAVESWA